MWHVFEGKHLDTIIRYFANCKFQKIVQLSRRALMKVFIRHLLNIFEGSQFGFAIIDFMDSLL